MFINYPFRINYAGRVDDTSYENHVYQLIEQVLFTTIGERVNRPTFGSNVMQLVFSPNSNTLAAANEFLIQSALQQWLSDLIQVETVQASNEDATLQITVQYILRETNQRQIEQFSMSTAA